MAYSQGRLPGEDVRPIVLGAMILVGLVGAVTSAQLAAKSDAFADGSSVVATGVGGDDDASAVVAGSIASDTSVSAPGDLGDAGTDTSATTTGGAVATTNRVDDDTVPVDGPSACPPPVTVLFERASAAPVVDPGPAIDELVKWLAAHPDTELLLDGHADAQGTEEHNLALSFRRAQAVAAMLTERGVDTHRVQVRGFGEYQPVVGVDPESEMNRRVLVRVEGRADCPVDNEES